MRKSFSIVPSVKIILYINKLARFCVTLLLKLQRISNDDDNIDCLQFGRSTLHTVLPYRCNVKCRETRRKVHSVEMQIRAVVYYVVDVDKYWQWS